MAGTEWHLTTFNNLVFIYFFISSWHSLATSSNSKQAFFMVHLMVFFGYDAMSESDTMLPCGAMLWH